MLVINWFSIGVLVRFSVSSVLVVVSFGKRVSSMGPWWHRSYTPGNLISCMKITKINIKLSMFPTEEKTNVFKYFVATYNCLVRSCLYSTKSLYQKVREYVVSSFSDISSLICVNQNVVILNFFVAGTKTSNWLFLFYKRFLRFFYFVQKVA